MNKLLCMSHARGGTVQIKLIVLTFLIYNSNAVFADTIWCKMFNAGCITEEQLQKQRNYCAQMGNDSYRENLNKALADPTVWQFAGSKSAQDYATIRERQMTITCFKTTTPQSY
ncbi:hypothetical protein C2759_04350 [Polynucleobacter sp. MG-Unter2-18]|uniref:hypothetical protein n=1 Tax=Polynucleobacter sp. MG-Unter2-18 TaxID=2081052 RepID=UPI001BFEA3E6|nr:hypothetical protein [Polynucleobacter sp. MG-Unter2-18]QWD95359.1 hypothetical protein C2759_04350 [Polynucleobacter sp. MG-Unter2-18]